MTMIYYFLKINIFICKYDRRLHMPKGAEKVFDRLLNLYVTKELLTNAKRAAKKKGLSVSENIRQLLCEDTKKQLEK